MHRDFLYPHRLSLHPPFLIDFPRFQFPQRRQPIITNYPAKHRILPIQMWRLSVGDEELTPVRIRPLIRHRHYSARIVSQRRADLIFEICAPDRGADFRGGGCWGAGLHHEGWKGSVEGRAIIGARGTEGQKVLSGR